MTKSIPPRIYCIPAINAPTVAVFRRGPSQWSQVGRWDLQNMRYEPGAWLRGRIFPRRSDLSPDGQYLCYFAHQPGATWEQGETYVALSKLPWLTALHAFPTCGTWTRGYYFTEKKEDENPELEELPLIYGLRPIPVIQFANERRRGWEESADSPQRDPNDFWDQRRNARMQKRQPGGNRLLCVENLGWTTDGIAQAIDGVHVSYWLEADGEIQLLNQLQWADWDQKGRLLVSTRSGKLQIWRFDEEGVKVLFEKDLSPLEPEPSSAPARAQRW